MTNYSRGADFERKVMEDLIVNHGFDQCVRSAGSHGAVDVLAFKLGEHWAVQCKINGRISPAERKKLVAFANIGTMKPIKAWRPKRGKIQYDEVT